VLCRCPLRSRFCRSLEGRQASFLPNLEGILDLRILGKQQDQIADPISQSEYEVHKYTP
jgi:hypothetical protein